MAHNVGNPTEKQVYWTLNNKLGNDSNAMLDAAKNDHRQSLSGHQIGHSGVIKGKEATLSDWHETLNLCTYARPVLSPQNSCRSYPAVRHHTHLPPTCKSSKPMKRPQPHPHQCQRLYDANPSSMMENKHRGRGRLAFSG